jgi:23S rRNA pseudouridine1911/1915/1917 synthase
LMTSTSDTTKNDGPGSGRNQRPDWLLLEDGPLIAVNKPAGILTEGVPQGEETMVGIVKAWLAEKYQKPGNVYLGIPHRLDRATSGTLVFTRNSKAAARVAEQFEKRQVSKTYWTLLEKRPEAESGLLVDWLLKVPDQAISEVVDAETPGAKEARLTYQTVREVDGNWLVEVQLLTGRMHQIRVQFASRGCPVVGDTKYGAGEWLTPGNTKADSAIAASVEAAPVEAASVEAAPVEAAPVEAAPVEAASVEAAPAEAAPVEAASVEAAPVEAASVEAAPAEAAPVEAAPAEAAPAEAAPVEAAPAEAAAPAASGDDSDDASKPVWKPASDVRIALHARSLTLLHPIRYDQMTIETPVPAYWDLSGESFRAKLRS